MGGCGMLSVSFILPVIGGFYDKGISANLPEGQTIESLAAAHAGSELADLWAQVQNAAGLHALETVAIFANHSARDFCIDSSSRQKIEIESRIRILRIHSILKTSP